jgi:hypothetical protein
MEVRTEILRRENAGHVSSHRVWCHLRWNAHEIVGQANGLVHLGHEPSQHPRIQLNRRSRSRVVSLPRTSSTSSPAATESTVSCGAVACWMRNCTTARPIEDWNLATPRPRLSSPTLSPIVGLETASLVDVEGRTRLPDPCHRRCASRPIRPSRYGPNGWLCLPQRDDAASESHSGR